MNYITITIEIEDPNDVEEAVEQTAAYVAFWGTVTGITVEEVK